MRLLRWLGYSLLTLVVAAFLLLFGARFADGPLAMIAGGPFSSGELVTGAEPDWSFVRDMATVEFQLEDPPRSRTTWILEHEGKIYIPSGYMTTPWGEIWKQWPIEAEQDGRAILRVNGKLYRRQLVRLEDGLAVEPVVKLLAAKYGLGKGTSETTTNATALVDSGYLWLFEMAPPRS